MLRSRKSAFICYFPFHRVEVLLVRRTSHRKNSEYDTSPYRSKAQATTVKKPVRRIRPILREVRPEQGSKVSASSFETPPARHGRDEGRGRFQSIAPLSTDNGAISIGKSWVVHRSSRPQRLEGRARVPVVLSFLRRG